MAPKKRIGGASSSTAEKTKVKILKFKVKSRGGYRDFLSKLRREFIVPGRLKYGIPVLREEKQPREADDFIQARLQTKENGVDLLIRKDNVYLVGFKEKNAEIFYEFKPLQQPNKERKKNKMKQKGERKIIPGFIPSSNLYFSENYGELAPEMHNLSFHKFTIRDAVDFLAKYKHRDDAKKNGGQVPHVGIEKVDDSEAKRHIGCLSIAICEALRLEDVATFVFKQMKTIQSEKLGSDLNRQIHNWKGLSKVIQNETDPPSEEDLDSFRQKIKLLKPVEGLSFPAPNQLRFASMSV